MRSFVTLAAVSASLLLAGQAVAQDRSITLQLTLADYSNPSRFDARLETAARRVCGVSGRVSLHDRNHQRACMDAAREQGRSQFGVLLAARRDGVIVLAAR
jgi:UrcA family protein